MYIRTRQCRIDEVEGPFCPSIFVSLLGSADVTTGNAEDVSELVSALSGREVSISADELRRMAAAHCLAVATVATRIVGMACLVVMDLPQGKRFHVETVVVDQQFRRFGIGRSLMERLLQSAAEHGDGQLSLTCNPGRVDAHEFYRELGFSVADTSVLRVPIQARAMAS
jgi:GNAT superfamily N-acetyltransferase